MSTKPPALIEGDIAINLIDKIKRTNSTILELRSKIFAPIANISAEEAEHFSKSKKRIIKTEYGSTIIKGHLLNQNDKDLLDICFAEAHEIKHTSSGGVAFFVKEESISSYYYPEDVFNLQDIKIKFDRLQCSAVEFKTNDNMVLYSFNIISTVAYMENINTFYIELSSDYCRFFEEQFSINYKDMIKDIMQINSAEVKAIVRYLWSFPEGISISIEELYKCIGIDTNHYSERKKKLQKAKIIASLLEIKPFSIQILKSLSIVLKIQTLSSPMYCR